MRCIFYFIGALTYPVAGHAGCANFQENPQNAPVVQICYRDACDITTQDYVCSNVSDYHAGYAIGWSIECTIEEGKTEGACTYFWQGRPIDPAKNDFITIKEIE